MPDELTRARQKELEARGRDLTKPEVQLGSTPESLRSVKGFEHITDEMLEERATFKLREPVRTSTMQIANPALVDMRRMSEDELRGLAKAAVAELDNREEKA